ncbi:glycoside hydrolase family 15 protein [Segeticoccus rhizosphaerae]|uniref:glycoside hydrolase family 15 protein n=1 Tax=Segeticoccus rhizosphaerae TaxID=1104777 RepID=UPI001EE45B5A|nr:MULTISPECIES: glycoside hydrolase family 15 protein [Intrasporangiaceae]
MTTHDPQIDLPPEDARSAFPPIGDYAFISDCQTTALIAPSGNIEWMCLPHMAGPSVFGAILDRDAGGFRLGPADQLVPNARRYVPGTMIVETSWGTPGGWIIVRDALLMGPWHHETERAHLYRRAPTDYDAEHVLLRTVRCVNGEVQLVLNCHPVFDYGRRRARWSYLGDGYHDAVAEGDEQDPRVRLTTDMRVGFEGPQATARTLMKEGDTHYVALSWTEHEPPHSYEEAYRRQVWTAHHWQHWLARGNFPDHPWRSHLERSALTLKGLTYAPTGALIAAPTTSLPETPGGERNWDYRYTWIRDSTLALWALDALGLDWEANDFFWFMADLAEASDGLQIMYGIDGAKDLSEEVLTHLEGHGGAKPVRIGNGAFDQKQHDVWGTLLDSVWIHTSSRDMLDDRLWQILAGFVDQAIEHWTEPDRGIWEVRGEPQHFTSSKVMCWVAVDRGVKLARVRENHELARRWQEAADEMHADICAHGVDSRGVFTQHYDTDALDASTLLIPLVGFLPPDDERLRATVLAIADELTVDGLVLRYRVDRTDDGLSGEEGTFTICSFWLVACLSIIGEHRRARHLCERLLSLATPLGLYAEQIEASSGRHLGNFPQAFTHLGLVNAVLKVMAAERDGYDSH